MQCAQLHCLGINGNNLGGGFAATSIEKDRTITWLETEHVPGVVGLGAGQSESAGNPFARRKMEAVHRSEKMNQESRKTGKKRRIWKPGKTEE